jgi:hypothetical protein
MNLPKYDIRTGETVFIYEFTSVGTKGSIQKMIDFQYTNLKDFYNLAFGDKDPITGEIDDKVVSNNGDMEKVLATIVAAVYSFTDRFPEAWIYAEGSTPARTRLYRINTVKYLSAINEDFDLRCLLNGEWEEFNPSVDYQGFVVKRKKQRL